MKTKLEFQGMPAQYDNGKIMYRLGDWLQPLPKLPDCIVSICAWHKNAKELRTKIATAGYVISDGICDECKSNIENDLNKQN